MYTIKQASLRTAIPVQLIRAWERRYGVVNPERSPSGYRLYDETAIARLRTMRALVDEGWSAAQAAAAVISRGTAGTAPTPSTRPLDGEAELVAAAAAYDIGAIERALDGYFGRGTYEAVIDDLVLPAAAELGTAWAAGRVDVAAEHLASGALARRLGTMLEQGGAPGAGQPVLVGLPPGSHHELGALAFAVALRRQGLNVLYVGPDVPIESWVDATQESRAVAAVVGVVTETDAGPAREVVTRLGQLDRPMLVAVGGSAANRIRARDVIVLPVPVVAAARLLRERLMTTITSPTT